MTLLRGNHPRGYDSVRVHVRLSVPHKRMAPLVQKRFPLILGASGVRPFNFMLTAILREFGRFFGRLVDGLISRGQGLSALRVLGSGIIGA